MPRRPILNVIALALLGACTLPALATPDTEAVPEVSTMRLPQGGIQPQVLTGANGSVHIVYYAGHPRQGDVFCISSTDGGTTFGDPIRVNSQEGSATVSIDAALGADGRVHVIWNGSGQAEPKAPGGTPPLLYSRLNDAGDGFDPQQNVIGARGHLDGGSAVAADNDGNVYVIWHAPIEGGHGEPDRRVWVARSHDDGRTFETETAAEPTPTGACACCAVNAFADESGTLYVMYRIAEEVVNRDMHLLVSRDGGDSFEAEKIHPWKVGQCVMSTSSFVAANDVVYTAWETKKQVLFGRIDPKTNAVAEPIAAPGKPKMRKHPRLVAGKDGQMLMVWTEGLMWGRGGDAAWQIYDASGTPLLAENGHGSDVPAFGGVAGFATDHGFTIVY